MYSNKQNVNILTALLVAHGVRHAVVCPGSRNAPIVHNLNECPDVVCHPVTDERSAGFYALGMAQMLNKPVVVCVTSGTALLNLAPAVAEACYQQLPLVVVSADRPAMWIDQQDGQTLPQPDALGRFVSKAVSLPEPANDDQRWYCNRLVNEALLACRRGNGAPVHINVPLTEPLFGFDVPQLPAERFIRYYAMTGAEEHVDTFVHLVLQARKPLVVVGQLSCSEACHVHEALCEIQQHVPVLYECLANAPVGAQDRCQDGAVKRPPLHIDKALHNIGNTLSEYRPDAVFCFGGTLIGKQLKVFLRQAHDAKTYLVNSQGAVYDTFKNLAGVFEGAADRFLCGLATAFQSQKHNARHCIDKPYYQRWAALLQRQRAKAGMLLYPYSQLLAVQVFFRHIAHTDAYILHAANSMSVRLVNIFSHRYVFCNRGVNGIEGSLSAAAGCSLVTPADVYCVIGDLSFFYDQNALWHTLGANFKILLLNNGGGGIFRSLPGLKDSAAHETLISAQHHTSARGICEQNRVTYLSASHEEALQKGMHHFVNHHFEGPVVFEVFTSPQQDEQAMNEYYQA